MERVEVLVFVKKKMRPIQGGGLGSRICIYFSTTRRLGRHDASYSLLLSCWPGVILVRSDVGISGLLLASAARLLLAVVLPCKIICKCRGRRTLMTRENTRRLIG